jgi:hypothetical protein
VPRLRVAASAPSNISRKLLLTAASAISCTTKLTRSKKDSTPTAISSHPLAIVHFREHQPGRTHRAGPATSPTPAMASPGIADCVKIEAYSCHKDVGQRSSAVMFKSSKLTFSHSPLELLALLIIQSRHTGCICGSDLQTHTHKHHTSKFGLTQHTHTHNRRTSVL